MSKILRIPRPRTDAQRAAARDNGAKSHGPVTDDGKAKSAMNALRHGLTAATLVLTTEDKPRFDELLNSYIDEYQPATQTETDLVQEITVSKWLQRRCWALQTSLIDVTMDRMDEELAEEFQEIPNSTRTALAFAKEANEGGALALLNRYAGRHSREWHKAVDKLRSIQKERNSTTPEAENLQHPPAHTTPQHPPAHEVSGHQELPNEPRPAVIPAQPERRDPANSQNEPEQDLTPISSTDSRPSTEPSTPNTSPGSDVLLP